MRKSFVSLASVMVVLASAPSWAITFQSLYSFPGDKSQGRYPEAALTIGPDGSLYGTASSGGTGDPTGDSGTAFKITTNGVFSVLGHFERSTTGTYPTARLLNIGDGFLYGATHSNSEVPMETFGGTVFKLNPAGGLSVVFNLPGGGTGPMVPTAVASGEPNVLHVLGSSRGGIWRVPLGGGIPTIASQFALTGDDGLFPSSLVRGADGKLYGTTEGNTYNEGLVNRRGTIFRTESNGSALQTLFEFHTADSGAEPTAAMALDSDGIFYGVTKGGGSLQDGVFYRFDPANFSPGTPGSGFTALTNLNDVSSSGGDVLLASDGKLYGTSEYLDGYVWRINKDGTGFQIVHQFNGTNGRTPTGGLVQALDGNLYGTTRGGGVGNNGTIYRIDLNLPAPPINHRPVAINDHEFSAGSAVSVDVLANDFDADEDILTITIKTQPQHGTATLQSGQIVYQPTPGGGYTDFDEFEYTVTDPDGLESSATVTITNGEPPAIWTAGVYNGILNLDPSFSGNTDSPRGQLVINVTETGLITGKLFTERSRLTVRGVVTEDGIAIAVVRLPKQGKALLFLAPGEGGVSVFLFGKETWSGVLAPLRANNVAAESKYTVILGTLDANLPVGKGFGAMRVFPNGLVTVVGKLGDGTRLATASTLVTVNGESAMPIYTSAVKGGAFAGLFLKDLAMNDVMVGEFRWIRPAASKPTKPYALGFAGTAGGATWPYQPSPKGVLPVTISSIGQAGVAGSQFPARVFGSMTSANGRITTTAPLKSFSINRKTGIYTGTMKVENRAVKFHGAVVQSSAVGFGQFTLDGITGASDFYADENEVPAD